MQSDRRRNLCTHELSGQVLTQTCLGVAMESASIPTCRGAKSTRACRHVDTNGIPCVARFIQHDRVVTLAPRCGQVCVFTIPSLTQRALRSTETD